MTKLLCRGGCGGVVGIVPDGGRAINVSENWCARCYERRNWRGCVERVTGDEPSQMRIRMGIDQAR